MFCDRPLYLLLICAALLVVGVGKVCVWRGRGLWQGRKIHTLILLFTDPPVCPLSMGLLMVPFQGAAQSRWEFYFRTGLGLGGKLFLRVEHGHFFSPVLLWTCAPCISRMESETPCSHSERRRADLPRAGGRSGPSREREAIIKNKNKKIEL